MIIYQASKQEFLRSVEEDEIADEIEKQVHEKMHRKSALSEYHSWNNSMQFMYKVLLDEKIPPDASVAIEYNIPQTCKRVDFLISGQDEGGHENVVIVELKQWEKVEELDDVQALVKTYTGNAMRHVVHPSYQAWSYASLLRDYSQVVQNKQVGLYPCAYLHNYRLHEPDPLMAKRYQLYIEDAPVFAKGGLRSLQSYIHSAIAKGDAKHILQAIDQGKLQPSKSLQNELARMLEGNPAFVLIDDQKVAYEQILSAALSCQKQKKKRTILVCGGPGTGKSVIAISLLAALTQEGQVVQYVSKNAAPRQVYVQKLKEHGGRSKSSIDNLFKGSGSYTNALKNSFSTLVVDEAHRLNAKSGLFKNMGENQIKEIIHASWCSVFFLDESQRVTLSDIGSKEEIYTWAKKLGSEVMELQLSSQFRCNGSDGYLSWLDDVLQIRTTANFELEDLHYDVRVVDSASKLRELIVKKNEENHNSRLLAGYCWQWRTDQKNNSDYYDIVIDDFAMSWNLGNSTFALDPGSIDQVGCIHTSQGLEFDYAGVIIGDDLRYEDGTIITDASKRAKSDQSLRGLNKLAKANPELARKKADEIIKNTYRTLLSRGMKGTYIYCTDASLQAYLKKRLHQE
jgi:hypothetical protein